jgi:hypothetical protein
LGAAVFVVVVEGLDECEDGPGDGFGFRCVDVVVGELEGEGEVEVEGEVDVAAGGALVVTVAAGVVAVTGGQDCETLVIGRLTGSGSELGGVPGGTFWKVKVWPPWTVMTTVQPSAEALGRAARPSTATVDPTVTAAILSLRLVNTVAYSSRGMPRAKSSELRSQVGLIRKLLAAAELCNWEPSVWWMSVRVPGVVTPRIANRQAFP